MSFHQFPPNRFMFPSGGLLPLPSPPPILPPTYLFHYTDERGKNSILEHQYIRKSFPAHATSTACFGEGVYLTCIPPDAPDYIILSNNWKDDGLSLPPHFWNGSRVAKLQYCFAIPTNSLLPFALQKMWEFNGRDVWVYRGGITLGDRNTLLKRRW